METVKERKLAGRLVRRRRGSERGIKKVYLLPNLFTTGNIASGVLSILFTVEGRLSWAAYAILVGCVCDLLDGRIARLTRTGSAFGVNYDSLSDLVTFGVAPGALMFQFFQRPGDKFLLPVVLIYTVCCALRLARFNVQASTTEKRGFRGLPTPAPAALIATLFLCVLLPEPPLVTLEARFAGLVMQVLALALAGLMVSEIPYPAVDARLFRRRHPFHYLVLLLMVVSFAIANPALTIFLVSSAYILYGPARLLLRGRFRHSVEVPGEADAVSRSEK